MEKHLILPDNCVCCGEPVPEGRLICWKCEHQYDGIAVKKECEETKERKKENSKPLFWRIFSKKY